jgi:transcriptional regulator of acetoin/glycerol metabolism
MRLALDRTSAGERSDSRAAFRASGAAGRAARPVPAPIVTSWKRSLAAGLDPEVFDVPYRGMSANGADLVRLARPVLDRLADSLDGTGVCLIFGDGRGTVTHRWTSERGLLSYLDRISLAPGFDYGERVIGTNAIGTALEQGGASFVVGAQHFADELAGMACAAVPLLDRSTGRVMGFLDATSTVAHAHPLMLALVRQAGAELERVLQPAALDLIGGSALMQALTPTEREVAELVVQGLTNRAAAHRLSISPHTVDTHLRHIFGKLGVGSRVELVRQLLAGATPQSEHHENT